ncbi:TetR family transcriptional regulator [Nocardioides sp. Arc9.136]|uniref:TetR family transcriptional regulator n=1 Tax=Nocardioides sp. Arc9.136 TaxID=2996826 RepID=UPI002664FAFB|nr:TetR family transcriptional regulator [Nocardioides sp. Arc9.136]WKN48703.1 TetR family transcriptional regulator [Nocardioides sp. Arc9.136]
MPRIAESRPPAAPVSLEQRARRDRIVRAATTIGARLPIDRVQMHDVAKASGVAIATLYRYFPSKTHLFAAVMADQVARLDAEYVGPSLDRDPADELSELLIRVGRRMLEHPVLTTSIMQSNNALTATPMGREVAGVSHGVMLRALRAAHDPEPIHLRLVRLVEQNWYGVLISILNGHTTQEEGEEDLRLAVRLLLTPLPR